MSDEGDDLRDLFGDRLVTSSELAKAPVEALISRGVPVEAGESGYFRCRRTGTARGCEASGDAFCL